MISVSGVSKVYRLYDRPIDRLKESLSLTHKNYHKDFYALRNIHFRVEKGEAVGIIGTNGSGKSTMLKIITGVLTPTEGEVKTRGTICALLELGAGFNQEYTGIENIYMNGAMMGFSREEMNGKLQAILDFADIGDFVHQPVKTYSSGMFVRLAFALYISVDPDVLIVDEALSVGDVFFQAKCYHRMDELKKKGTTILMVTHDLGSVMKYCDRVILLNAGEKISEGLPGEMVDLYKKILAGQYDPKRDQTPQPPSQDRDPYEDHKDPTQMRNQYPIQNQGQNQKRAQAQNRNQKQTQTKDSVEAVRDVPDGQEVQHRKDAAALAGEEKEQRKGSGSGSRAAETTGTDGVAPLTGVAGSAPANPSRPSALLHPAGSAGSAEAGGTGDAPDPAPFPWEKEGKKMQDFLQLNPSVQHYGNGKAEIYDFGILDAGGQITNVLLKGEYFSIRECFRFHDTIQSPIFTFTIKDKRGMDLSGTNTMFEGKEIGPVGEGDEYICTFRQKMNLQGGEYLLSMSCTGFEQGVHTVYDRRYDIASITVLSNKNTVGVYDMDSEVILEKRDLRIPVQ